jgi:hypothetical protein
MEHMNFEIPNWLGGRFMRSALYAILVAALVMGVVACSKETSTNADSLQPRSTPEAPVADNVKPEPKPEPKQELKPRPAPITVAAGTKLRIALIDPVSSDKSHAGDPFMASLAEPVIVDGKTVLAKGTKVRGRVVDAKDSGRVKGRASIELTLTQIVRDGHKTINISTKPYSEVAESTKKRDAAMIAGGAGLGAAIGAIAGGGKGAAIGAGVGGGAGTGTVLATKGKEIRFAPEHPLSFTLANSIQL